MQDPEALQGQTPQPRARPYVCPSTQYQSTKSKSFSLCLSSCTGLISSQSAPSSSSSLLLPAFQRHSKTCMRVVFESCANLTFAACCQELVHEFILRCLQANTASLWLSASPDKVCHFRGCRPSDSHQESNLAKASSIATACPGLIAGPAFPSPVPAGQSLCLELSKCSWDISMQRTLSTRLLQLQSACAQHGAITRGRNSSTRCSCRKRPLHLANADQWAWHGL